MSNSKVTHVIFDLDGTLIDSEKFLHLAINDVLGQFGKTMDLTLRAKTVGLHMGQSAPFIIEHCKLQLNPADYTQMVMKRYIAYLTGEIDGVGVRFLPGAQRLVKHLASHKIPLAICTGSFQDTYDLKTRCFGDFFTLGQYFHHVVLGGSDPEVSENKPSPQPYLICIDRFATQSAPTSASNVLAFEDSPTGLLSAISAGCQTVFIPDSKFDCSKMLLKPTITIDSLEHFKPEDFALPPF